MTDRLDLTYDSPRPPADLLDRVHGSVRRRARRRRAGAGLALGAVVVTAAVGLPHLAATPRPDRLATDRTVAPAPAPVPAQLVAFTGGGDEQPVLVDTASGRLLRVLGPRAQLGGVLSPDRTTLYLPIAPAGTWHGWCTQDWWAVDVATGGRTLVPALHGLATFALSPDGTRFAAAVDPGACRGPGDVRAMRLTVRGLDGTPVRSAVLPSGNWFVTSWSPQGGSLLLDDRRPDARVFAVHASTGALARTAVVPTPATGCAPDAATLRGDADVLLTDACTDAGSASLRLREVDVRTDAQLRQVTVATGTGVQAPTSAGVLSLDRSGTHVLLSVGGLQPDGQVVSVTGTTVTRSTLTGVFGALW